MERQRIRWITRSLFFALFILAPIFDLFRLDLTQGHFMFLGMDWAFRLDALTKGEQTALQAFINIVTLGFIPIALIILLGIWISWKYGRLYCGWLCPHFSVVETINNLMRRACGKPSLWEQKTLPEKESDGSVHTRQTRYWAFTYLAILGFAFTWAVVLLTYLLPPKEIYYNLYHWQLTRNQALFTGVATTLFTLEFIFARHLFCRFGCAIGLFQSLAWMCNDNAQEISFDRTRGDACKTCTQACDNACPMRLNPRKNKRHMFTCTQCTLCVSACEKVQSPEESLLKWQPTNTDTNPDKAKQAPIHFN